MSFYLGIDLGTTGTKSVLFDDGGNLLGKGYKGYSLITPKENIFEQSPEDWYSAVVETVKSAISNFDGVVDALSVSAQGGSFVFCDVNEKGEIIALTNAITWMDRRAELEAEEFCDKIYAINGVKIGAGSVLSKILWFKKHKPEIFAKTKLILSTSDYVYYKLTGRAVIDYTSAAMMGFFDSDKNAYNKELLNLVGLNESQLPVVLNPGDFIDNANKEFISKVGLEKDIKVYCGLHDQFAASLGANYFSNNDVIISTGTTWVVFARNLEKKLGKFSTRKHPDGGYGYFNSAVSSGTVLEWTKNNYNLSYDEMNKLASESVIDEKLFVYPFVSGNGSYRGDNLLTYGVEGVSFKHKKGDIFRATMESVAFEIKQIINDFKQKGFELNNFIVTGGATRSDIWMQILSDVLGEKLYISEQVDGCCFGAYSVAKKGETNSFEKFQFTGVVIEPNKVNNALYEKKFLAYNQNLSIKQKF